VGSSVPPSRVRADNDLRRPRNAETIAHCLRTTVPCLWSCDGPRSSQAVEFLWRRTGLRPRPGATQIDARSPGNEGSIVVSALDVEIASRGNPLGTEWPV
jgi:hypothetical protein